MRRIVRLILHVIYSRARQSPKEIKLGHPPNENCIKFTGGILGSYKAYCLHLNRRLSFRLARSKGHYHMAGTILFREPTLSAPNFAMYHSLVPTAVTPRLVATNMVPQATVQLTNLPSGAAMSDSNAYITTSQV